MDLLIGFSLGSLLAWIVLRQNGFSESVRSWTLRLLLAAAIACFGAAPFLKGEYTEDVILFIGGPIAYRVETLTRSFTGLAFGIGGACLVLFAILRWGEIIPWNTPLGRAVKLSLVLLFFRVYFEKLALPQDWVIYIGIIWLIVPLPVYFGLEAARLSSQTHLWKWLTGYTYGIRIPVLVVMLVATGFQLGTHFDNSSITRYTILDSVYEVVPGSWDQYWSLILFPQLILWPAATLACGALLGLPAYFLMSRRLRREPAA